MLLEFIPTLEVQLTKDHFDKLESIESVLAVWKDNFTKKDQKLNQVQNLDSRKDSKQEIL